MCVNRFCESSFTQFDFLAGKKYMSNHPEMTCSFIGHTLASTFADHADDGVGGALPAEHVVLRAA